MQQPIVVISVVYIILFLFVIFKRDEIRPQDRTILDWLGLKNNSRNGSALLIQLFQFSESVQKTKSDLKPYKWFDGFLMKILEIKKKFGHVEKEVFESLKIGLKSDIQQERLKEETNSKGFFQLLLTSLTTVAFAIYSMNILNLKIGFFLIFIPLLFSLIALICFSSLTKLIYQKMLLEYDLLIEGCFKFKILSSFRMPIESVVEQSEIESLFVINWTERIVEERYEWFLSQIENWKKSGGNLSPRLAIMVDELFNLREIKFKRYNQFIQLLQFILTLIVSLPIFFYTVYRILSSQFSNL